jgi:amino acid transporter
MDCPVIYKVQEAPMSDHTDFKRSLNVFQGLALAVSFVVGSGLLGLPGIVLDAIGPYYSALSWVLTSVAMFPLIIVFSRLGVHFPSAPGLLAYSEFAFGKFGKKAASLMLLGSFGFGMPALMLIAGSYLQVLFGVGSAWVPPLALLVLTVSVGLNLVGLRTTTAFNAVSVAVLVIFIAALTVAKHEYFGSGVAITEQALADLRHPQTLNLPALWRGATLIFWAFIGWESLSFGVMEFKNPTRSVPLIFGLSYVVVTVLYWALAFTTVGAVHAGVDAVASPSGVIALLNGSILEPVCLMVIVLLILGNANAWVYSGSRFFFAEAKEGILPSALATLSDRDVPVRCLLTIYVVSFFFTALWGFAHFPISDLILLVNQNFLFLFLASIVAYAKCDPSPLKFVVIPVAALTCSLFLSGFSFWVAFPLGLMAAGAVLAYFDKSPLSDHKPNRI